VQAITTKYLGPTDHKGSRIKATCQAGSITLEWDSTLDSTANHDKAAVALADKLGWREGYHGDMVRGSPLDGGYVYCFTGRKGLNVIPGKSIDKDGGEEQ
jgi:hypothetical protein